MTYRFLIKKDRRKMKERRKGTARRLDPQRKVSTFFIFTNILEKQESEENSSNIKGKLAEEEEGDEEGEEEPTAMEKAKQR
jgi:hypothetical protein